MSKDRSLGHKLCRTKLHIHKFQNFKSRVTFAQVCMVILVYIINYKWMLNSLILNVNVLKCADYTPQVHFSVIPVFELITSPHFKKTQYLIPDFVQLWLLTFSVAPPVLSSSSLPPPSLAVSSRPPGFPTVLYPPPPHIVLTFSVAPPVPSSSSLPPPSPAVSSRPPGFPTVLYPPPPHIVLTFSVAPPVPSSSSLPPPSLAVSSPSPGFPAAPAGSSLFPQPLSESRPPLNLMWTTSFVAVRAVHNHITTCTPKFYSFSNFSTCTIHFRNITWEKNETVLKRGYFGAGVKILCFCIYHESFPMQNYTP